MLSAPGSRVVHDPGDPLLNSAILAWNATHLPGSEAWWQFPIFHPTRDALAFSEHLLGVSVVSTPIYWLTGARPIEAYNLTLLLTYPLCGMAMYALVHALTRSAQAAFLAGLAFAFAPYRVAHLPHIQVLAVFWAPLALLGLHRYLESGRRGWLVVYGVCWMLQGAANGYLLVFFSVLVGFWTAWFVAARRRWRDLAAIAAATVLALVPFLPVLLRYLTVHARHAFTRGSCEIASFAADVAAPLCAPAHLAVWGWLRTACGPEGELFPGVALLALCAAGVAAGALRRGTGAAFYLTAAIAAWVLSWGPAPALFGEPVLPHGPYAWLMQLPGVGGLRVPARFWMIAVTCLAVLLGISAAALLRGRTGRMQAGLVALAAGALLADGWATIPWAPVPQMVPDRAVLRGQTVLHLPLGDPHRDVIAAFHAVAGGWRIVNGFSGYEPAYYDGLRRASRAEDPAVFEPFARRGDLHVLVMEEAPRLWGMVEEQPDARAVGRAHGFRQYVLPFRKAPSTPGSRLDIAAVDVSCSAGHAPLMTDGNSTTRWECGVQTADQELTITLESPAPVAAVVHGLGPYSNDYPRHLLVDTSADGVTWDRAWDGPVLGRVLAARVEDGSAMRVVLAFPPREARYVRLRQVGREPNLYWSVAEVEVWSGGP